MQTEEQRRRRDTKHYMSGMRRFMRGLGARVGSGETSGTGDEERYLFMEAEKELHEVQAAAIAAMRASGVTDGQIAKMLGVTRQAVSKRWPGGGTYKGARGRYH